MNVLLFQINEISDLNLSVMQAVINRNEESKKLTEDGLGPLALANALSDFYMISATLEIGHNTFDEDQVAEFADYGLDLLDRLAVQLRQLEIMDQREAMSRIYASIAIWLARQGAVLDNIEGVADGFAWLVNGLTETDDLAAICKLMQEVTDAASEKLLLDEDRSNPWRPWRVLNLNTGIAATRSLDPELMETVFEKLGRYLPYDMANFIADGKNKIALQNVPDEVKAVMDRYAEKWPVAPVN